MGFLDSDSDTVSSDSSPLVPRKKTAKAPAKAPAKKKTFFDSDSDDSDDSSVFPRKAGAKTSAKASPKKKSLFDSDSDDSDDSSVFPRKKTSAPAPAPAKPKKKSILDSSSNESEDSSEAIKKATKKREEEERLEKERLATEEAEKKRKEQERLAAEAAEKQRLEDEHRAAEAAEKERLEKQAAEAAEKERLEKQAAEAAEKERLEKEAAEAAEKERLEKEAAEAAEKERLEKEAAEAAEKERLEKEAAEAAEKEILEKGAAGAAEKERLEKEAAEAAEKERLEKEGAEVAEKERLEKESAEKERLEKDAAVAAEKEKLEKEAAEKEPFEKERFKEEASEAAEKERAAGEGTSGVTAKEIRQTVVRTGSDENFTAQDSAGRVARQKSLLEARLKGNEVLEDNALGVGQKESTDKDVRENEDGRKAQSHGQEESQVRGVQIVGESAVTEDSSLIKQEDVIIQNDNVAAATIEEYDSEKDVVSDRRVADDNLLSAAQAVSRVVGVATKSDTSVEKIEKKYDTSQVQIVTSRSPPRHRTSRSNPQSHPSDEFREDPIQQGSRDREDDNETPSAVDVPPAKLVEEKQTKVPDSLPFFAAKEAVIEHEIPRIIMGEMMSNNVATVANGIKKLARHFHSMEKVEKQKEALRMGGHTALLTTMKRWPATSKIQANACVCMQNMMSDYPEAKRAFSSIGGMEAVMVTMCNFPRSSQIQSFGCGALNNYLSGIDGNAQKIADRFVHKLEGVDLLLYIMREFPTNARLHERACRIFLNLCTFPDCKETIRKAGAISAVAASIDTHAHDPGIQRWGPQFMKIFFC